MSDYNGIGSRPNLAVNDEAGFNIITFIISTPTHAREKKQACRTTVDLNSNGIPYPDLGDG